MKELNMDCKGSNVSVACPDCTKDTCLNHMTCHHCGLELGTMVEELNITVDMLKALKPLPVVAKPKKDRPTLINQPLDPNAKLPHWDDFKRGISYGDKEEVKL